MSSAEISAFCALTIFGAGAACAADDNSTVEELVVTARRTEENLQSTPVAISAFTQESLARQGAVNVTDLQGAVGLGVPVSVDTYKPEVMRAVLDAGADIINDVWALRRGDGMATVAAHPSCGVCLMHMHLEPQTMQVAPMTGDVVAQVRGFLRERAAALQAAGVARERIALDVGIGFGKTVAQNFALLAAQADLMTEAMPWLVGWSRKSSLGAVTGRS